MCYFITIAVDEKHESLLKQKLRSSFRLAPSNNPSIVSYLEPTDRAFTLTKGMCSCDLYRRPNLAEDQEGKLRRKYSKPKYRKRGWTESRIDRVIADRLTKPVKDFSGLRSDVWLQLCELAKETGRVSLIIHFYSGRTETENVPIQDKNIVKCSEKDDDSKAVTEDTLIEIQV